MYFINNYICTYSLTIARHYIEAIHIDTMQNLLQIFIDYINLQATVHNYIHCSLFQMDLYCQCLHYYSYTIIGHYE